jgi:hypothetical protein
MRIMPGPVDIVIAYLDPQTPVYMATEEVLGAAIRLV